MRSTKQAIVKRIERFVVDPVFQIDWNGGQVAESDAVRVCERCQVSWIKHLDTLSFQAQLWLSVYPCLQEANDTYVLLSHQTLAASRDDVS